MTEEWPLKWDTRRKRKLCEPPGVFTESNRIYFLSLTSPAPNSYQNDITDHPPRITTNPVTYKEIGYPRKLNYNGWNYSFNSPTKKTGNTETAAAPEKATTIDDRTNNLDLC